MEILVCYLVGVGTFVVGFIAGVVLLARQYQDRWVTASPTQPGGEGAFRSAPITPDPRRQRRRFFVYSMAIVNVVWAAATLFFLAPAGVLGVLVSNGSDSWFWVSIGIAAADAIPVSILLLSSSLAIVKRSFQSVRLGSVSAVWSLAHHLALVALGVAYLVRNGEAGAFTAVVAGFGALLAAAALAAHQLARDEMPTDAAPTDAAPTDAAPTDAAPTDAAPTEPAPTEPAPTEPAPTDAAPTEPAPREPAPTEPAPGPA